MLVSTVDRSPNNEERVVMGEIQNMSSDFCECFPIYRRIIIFLEALKVNAVVIVLPLPIVLLKLWMICKVSRNE